MKRSFWLVSIIAFAGAINLALVEKPTQDKWVAPERAQSLTNPWSGSKSIKNGAKIYKTRCVICHGEKGKGDGIGSKALNPKPADHTATEFHKQTDGEIFWKISEGRGRMVGWGKGSKPILTETDRWDLVNYIRTLEGQ